MIQTQDKWYRQRTIFLVLAVTQIALSKTVQTAIAVFVLRYYRDILKVGNPKAYYGVAMSALFASGLISAKVSAWYMDKTQNIQRTASFALAFASLGSLIYSIPLSKWLPILGLVMIGLTEGLRISMAAELSRVYDKRSLAKLLTILELAGVLSFIFGPNLPLMFSRVDFQIGYFRITMYNAFTIMAGCFFGLFWLACYFLLPNLTLNPKYETLKFEIFKDQPDKTLKKNEQSLTMRDLAKNVHLFLFYSAEATWCYCYYQTDLLINMVATYELKWSPSMISGMLATSGFISFVLLILVQRYCLKSSINIYYFYISCFILMAMTQSLLNLIIAMQISGTTLQLILFGFVAVCQIFQGGGSAACLRWLLFTLSPANAEIIVESNRYVVSAFFTSLGFFLSGFVYPHLGYIFPAYNVLCYIVISALFYKQKKILYKLDGGVQRLLFG